MSYPSNQSSPPVVQSFSELVDNKYPGYNMKSLPNNSACKVKNESCSKEMMKDDLCFWHSYRQAKIVEMACACTTHQVLVGDAIGRRLAYTYYGMDCFKTPTIGLCSDEPYCCGQCMNGDTEAFKCGSFNVCYGCAQYHDIEKMVSLEPNYEDYGPSDNDSVS